jgi:hypothetical protein
MPPRSTPFIILLALAALALGGCTAVQRVAAGPHLVYRDASGTPTMQIDYPSADMCRRVEEVAAHNAKCQANSEAAQLHARAVLWYNPPNIEVEAHYTDLTGCEKANSRMARGVHLQKPCAAK